MNVSILVTTFNGEKFLSQQLDSILRNMRQYDELIIVDDGSSDKTVDIIKKYIDTDSRVFFYTSGFHCHQKAIEFGVSKVKNDIIFYSDQDDIWMDDKIEKCIPYFENDSNLLLLQHDAITIDENNIQTSGSIIKQNKIKKGFFKNIIKGRYFGCCMVAKKELFQLATPFPTDVYFDYWLGLIADSKKRFKLVNLVLTQYRRHSTNQTTFKRRGIRIVLKSRFKLIKNIIKFRKKFKRQQK